MRFNIHPAGIIALIMTEQHGRLFKKHYDYDTNSIKTVL